MRGVLFFCSGILAALLLFPASLQAEAKGVLQFQKPEEAKDFLQQGESVQMEDELLRDYTAALLSSKSVTEYVKEAGNFSTQASRYLTVADRLLGQRYQILGSLDQMLLEIDRFLAEASHKEIETRLEQASSSLQNIEQEFRRYKGKLTNGTLSRADRQQIRWLRWQYQLEASRRNLLASRLAGKKASTEALAQFREDLHALRDGVEGVFGTLEAHRNDVALVAAGVHEELAFLVENGSPLVQIQGFTKRLEEVFPLATDLEERTRSVMEAVPHLGSIFSDLAPNLGLNRQDDEETASFLQNFDLEGGER